MVDLDQDFTVPEGARFYVTDNIILPIPDGKTFTVPAGSHLDIAGTVEIQSGGKLVNNGAYRLASIGKLINNGGIIEGSGTTPPPTPSTTRPSGTRRRRILPTARSSSWTRARTPSRSGITSQRAASTSSSSTPAP